MKFEIYAVVRLKRSLPGLAAGAIGTVVMAYEYPREGYDVEFLEYREKVPVLTMYPEDLELVVAGSSSGPERWEG